MKYLVYGEETCPTTGKKHWQGYVEWIYPCSLTGCKQYIPEAHWEVRKGTAAQAATYCKKEGKYKEYGQMSVQGKRNDLKEVAECIRSGLTIEEIAENHPEQYMKYHAGISSALTLRDRRISSAQREVAVYCLIGPTGCGKTRHVYEESTDLFDIVATGSKMWFDGYRGQKDLLIDEMDANCIPYRFLLRLLDRYPLNVEIKGGYTSAQWTRVYITSNVPIEKWYPGQDVSALKRRISAYPTPWLCAHPPS